MKKSLKGILLLNYISVASISAALITPALPHVGSFYHIGRGAISWIISIFLIAYMLGQLLYGPIANRFGRVSALRAGLVINLIGIVLCVLAIPTHQYWLLLLGRFVTALGASSGLVCTFILINEIFEPDEAKSLLGYAIVAFTAGLAVAVFLGGFLTEYLNWGYCFVLLFIHGFILLRLTKCIQETLAKENRQSLHLANVFGNYAVAFFNKRLVIYSLLVGMIAVFSYAFSAGAPIISHGLLHNSAAVYGVWNVENAFGMCLGGFLAAKLINKLGAKHLLGIGFSLYGLSLLSLVVFAWAGSVSSLWFFSTTTLAYLATGFLYPAASGTASTAIADKASASAAMSFINMGSAFLMVVVMGYLPLTPLLSFIVVLLVFFLLVVVLLPFAKEKASRRSQQQ
jgi:MFS transporter, DHA1 family, multidrug resistance protein